MNKRGAKMHNSNKKKENKLNQYSSIKKSVFNKLQNKV